MRANSASARAGSWVATASRSMRWACLLHRFGSSGSSGRAARCACSSSALSEVDVNRSWRCSCVRCPCSTATCTGTRAGTWPANGNPTRRDSSAMAAQHSGERNEHTSTKSAPPSSTRCTAARASASVRTRSASITYFPAWSTTRTPVRRGTSGCRPTARTRSPAGTTVESGAGGRPVPSMTAAPPARCCRWPPRPAARPSARRRPPPLRTPPGRPGQEFPTPQVPHGSPFPLESG